MAYDGSLKFDTKLDNKGFEKGMKGLQSIAKGSVKAVTTLMKGAATAVAGIGIASIKAGSDFEAGMSNVAATMGITTEEIAKGSKEFKLLEKAALEMGKTTQFSASDATEALNYLALAGYDAEKSVDTLPRVLNLAAAGGLELGRSAEIVTNAVNALGLETKDAEKLVDQMAVTAQKSGTDVNQLGDAILTVGGTAKVMAGGTVELNTQLGILADAGIKGAEGGTALRNVLLSLSAPTDKQAKALKSLGIETYDANGNFRNTNDIFEDLNGVLGTMTEQERTAVLSDLFNKVDLKAANALLAGSGDRFEELSEKIRKSEGAAEEMAATLNDNLKGKIELLKSAMEYLGIQIYKSVDSPIKDVVETLTGYVDQISGILTAHDDMRESMTELGYSTAMIEEELRGVPSGFEAAVETLGEIIADMILRLAEAAPRFLEMGVNLVKAFLDGLRQNLPEISQSAVELIQGFATAYLELLPEIIVLGIELIANLIQGIAEMIPELIPVAVQSIDTIMTSLMDNLPLIIEAGIQIIVALIEGIADNLPQLIDQSIDLIVLVADALIDNLPLIIEAGLKLIVALVKGIIDSLPKLIEEAPRIINDFADSIYNQLPTILKVGVKLLLEIIKGLIQTIPTLIANLPQIIMAIVNAFTLYNWWNLGKGVISKLGQGISGMVSNLGSIARDLASKAIQAIKNIFTQAPSVGSGFVRGIITGIGNLIGSLLSTITNLGSRAITSVKTALAPSKLVSIGSNMVKGIWNGISNVTGWILSKIKGFGSSVMKGIKGIFGIKSPSTLMRDEIGKNLALGIGVGFEAETDGLNKDINKEMTTLARSMQATVDFETAKTSARMIAGNGFNGRVSSISNDDNSENNIIITDNEFHIREEADIEKVAIELDRLRVRRSRV